MDQLWLARLNLRQRLIHKIFRQRLMTFFVDFLKFLQKPTVLVLFYAYKTCWMLAAAVIATAAVLWIRVVSVKQWWHDRWPVWTLIWDHLVDFSGARNHYKLWLIAPRCQRDNPELLLRCLIIHHASYFECTFKGWFSDAAELQIFGIQTLRSHVVAGRHISYCFRMLLLFSLF